MIEKYILYKINNCLKVRKNSSSISIAFDNNKLIKHFQKKIITRLLDKNFLFKSYFFKDYLLTFNK